MFTGEDILLVEEETASILDAGRRATDFVGQRMLRKRRGEAVGSPRFTAGWSCGRFRQVILAMLKKAVCEGSL